MPERIRLRIGNMGKAVLVTGQAYQDPKDALNEFVSNAADEYAEAGLRGQPATGRKPAPQLSSSPRWRRFLLAKCLPESSITSC
jgi:hypothetical protein